ncbi:hypothetical protein HS7_09300 [Sulfolobales archaeon HS-7]|nr:hypothetical protein HS7_09300 [Sulfolobales archaeon HS-7]
MVQVYRYKDVFIAGIPHEIPGYIQDVVFIRKVNNKWISESAERYKTDDPDLQKVKLKLQYSTLEDDLIRGVAELVKDGITITKETAIPFPQNLLRSTVKIQEEFD